MNDITLVVLPYASFRHPSLAIGALTASCQKEGLSATDIYPALDFANTIGIPEYDFLAEGTPVHFLLGEWTFYQAAFAHFSPDMKTKFMDYLASSAFGKKVSEQDKNGFNRFRELMETVSKQATLLISDTAKEIVASGSRIVGSTTSFQQLVPTIALFREIKRLNPEIITIAGGASCEEIMGKTIFKKISDMDIVVSGEADDILPIVCRHILEDKKIPDTFGGSVFIREKLKHDSGINPFNDSGPGVMRTEDLNHLPVPEFSGYFQKINELFPDERFMSCLIMETSRGCWKGEKQPCNFCGLTGKRVKFRRKYPERVLSEFKSLTEKWPAKTILTSDTILDPKLFHGFLDKLAQMDEKYHLFFETSSTLREKQVKKMAEAGIVWIQPGIENLHDDLLGLLNKGNQAIQNIALLKFTLENGIYTSWNLLFCIPGEKEKSYREMARYLPLLAHLQPPNSVAAIRFDRFSHYFDNKDTFQLDLEPMTAYQLLFQHFGDDIKNVASFFRDNGGRVGGARKDTLGRMEALVEDWRRQVYKPKEDIPVLFHEDDGEIIRITDTRPCHIRPVHILNDRQADIFRICRHPIREEAILRALRKKRYYGKMLDAWKEDIIYLINQKLMICINDKYLTLSVKKTEHQLNDILKRLATIRKIKPPGTSRPKKLTAMGWFAKL